LKLAGTDLDQAINLLVLGLDLAGTFVFALSGALAGVKHRLDVFGIMVLSFAASNAGGILRDLLIGAVPPAAIQDWRYLGTALVAGALTVFLRRFIQKAQEGVLVFDAAGLALFAVSGAQKALDFGLNPLMAAMLGMVTGIGGGVVRDLLLREIPTVLRSEIYALAALAGAAAAVWGQFFMPATLSGILGALLCFGIRMLALRRNWNLPPPVDSA
jgi:uncharacterized membrane protein YeiH